MPQLSHRQFPFGRHSHLLVDHRRAGSAAVETRRGANHENRLTGSGGRLHLGMVAGFKSEPWPASNRYPLGRLASEFSRVEEGRGCVEAHLVSLPRSSNRTCGFAASGFPTDFTLRLTAAHAGPAGKALHAEFPEDFAPRRTSRASVRRAVRAGEEVPHAVADMVIDGAVGRVQSSIAEVRRPTAKKAVQSLAHLRPDAHFARLQQLADLALDPLQALLRGTRAKIRLAVLGTIAARTCSPRSRSPPRGRSSTRSSPR